MNSYPTTPDMTIREGDRVRSFDFPGLTEHYVEGVVTRIQWHEGCNRYRIAVEVVCSDGVRVSVAKQNQFVLPPVNGTGVTFGGTCRGVVRV
jgi:hypothetical protein